MENMMKIGVLVGSLRKDSYTAALARYIVREYGNTIKFNVLFLEELELYNQDYDDEKMPAASWTKFRKKLHEQDGFLFLTPEHNRSVPAVLKNAIDIGSRPPEYNMWNKKPSGVISTSVGKGGGMGAAFDLRKILSCVNSPVLSGPEAYIGNIKSRFKEDFEEIEESTVLFIEDFMKEFILWCNHFCEPIEHKTI